MMFATCGVDFYSVVCYDVCISLLQLTTCMAVLALMESRSSFGQNNDRLYLENDRTVSLFNVDGGKTDGNAAL